MKRLLSVCFLLMLNISVFAGTLSITVDAEPAPGLPSPVIVVTRGFTYYQQKAVNWGDTWNLIVPAGTYRIQPLPVTDGTNIYGATTVNIIVPAIGTATTTITYHMF